MSTHKKLRAFFNELGLEIKMDEFSKRKHLQKLVYIIQEFGINLNFKFDWYLYGPYSPELTQVAFEIEEQYEDNKLYEITSSDKFLLKMADNFLGDDKFYPNRLELLASLMYMINLVKKENEIPIEYKDQIITALKKIKTQYSYKEIEKAWIKIESLNKIKVTNNP